MNKTLTINLSGIVFNIDEDAYKLLCDYIRNLNDVFKKCEGKEEIVADIEARISEILSEKFTDPRSVISLSNIEDIITRMGRPEEFGSEYVDKNNSEENKSEDATSENGTRTTPPPYIPKVKRLYRNPQNKMIGGVCSGLAAYLNIDPTWVRLIFVGLAFLTFTFVVGLYIVLRFIVPEAKNAAEQLAMTGETPTMENIGKTVKNSFEKVADSTRPYLQPAPESSGLKKFADSLVTIFVNIFKILLFIIAILCIPIVGGLALAFVVCILVLLGFATNQGIRIYSNIPIEWGNEPTLWLLIAIFVCLTLMIPLFYLSFSILRSTIKFKFNLSKAMNWSMVILWIMSFIATVICITLADSSGYINI